MARWRNGGGRSVGVPSFVFVECAPSIPIGDSLTPTMAVTPIQRLFAPVKRLTPGWLSGAIRSVGTAALTPLYFSARSGHFKSSFQRAAVSSRGEPLPWYTFPCIDFLRQRNFEGRSVLEFGGGQSSIWWAKQAKRVLTFEGDQAWHDRIRGQMPTNVDLQLVQGDSQESRVSRIKSVLAKNPAERFDVIIIDGLDRRWLVPIACECLAPGGVIICDNSEGYGFHEAFRGREIDRVDFYGHAPGVILPHCTSVFFRGNAFVFGHDAAAIRVEYGW